MAYSHVQAAAASLGRYARVFTVSKSHELYNHTVQPSKWESYGGIPEERLQRVSNHVNQYASWKMCSQKIRAIEFILSRQTFTLVFYSYMKRLIAQASEHAKYNMILRIRDNSLIVQPFNLYEAFLHTVGINKHLKYDSKLKRMVKTAPECAFRSPTAITKACASYGGYSDK
eukprot:scaffold263678_cov44-Prasinocladus_malaysianus.AAC.2